MRQILTLAIGLAASQAQALQCLRPDPVRAFQAAMAAPEDYVVLQGSVAEAEILIPLPNDKLQSHPVPGWFSGLVLTGDGFTQGLETPVTVQVTCAGPWCGSMLPEADLIMFAQVADGAYTIEATPCETWVFPSAPLTADLLTSCIQGNACVPTELAD